MLADGKANVTRRAIARIAQRRNFLFDFLQVRGKPLLLLFARLGRGDIAGGAGQQPHVETAFQIAHRMA